MSKNSPLRPLICGIDYALSLKQKFLVSIIIFFILCNILLFAYKSSQPFYFDVWGVADWLINFRAGFIRRGLSGEAILLVSEFLKLRPEFTVFLFKAGCYFIIYFGLILLIFRNANFILGLALIILSPATYLFPLLEPDGGGRKEILLITIVTLVCIFRPAIHSKFNQVIASFCFLVLCAIHEGLFFFYPMAILAAPYMLDQDKLSIKVIFYILLPSMLYVVFLHYFTFTVDQKFLESMMKAADENYYEKWFGGAVSALQLNAKNGAELVAYHFNLWSIPSTIFAIGLIATSLKLLIFTKNFSVPSIEDLRLFILAALFQLPLWIISIDWGRWIYINASIIALIFISQSPKNAKKVGEPRYFGYILLTIFLILTNATCWKIFYGPVTGAHIVSPIKF